MAVALDSSSKIGTAWQSGSPTSITFSHTCTGSNLILVVGAYTATATEYVTGITYNGEALTKITHLNPGGGDDTVMYYKIGPATGANNIVVSQVLGNNFIWAAGESLTGAKQSAQPDSFATNSTFAGTSAGLTYTTTVVADNSWLSLITRGSANASAGAGTVLRQDGTNGTNARFWDSNATVASGSRSLVTNGDAGAYNSGIIISIAPAVSGGIVSTAKKFTGMALLGVGA